MLLAHTLQNGLWNNLNLPPLKLSFPFWPQVLVLIFSLVYFSHLDTERPLSEHAVPSQDILPLALPSHESSLSLVPYVSFSVSLSVSLLDPFHRHLICSDLLHLFKNNSPLTPLYLSATSNLFAPLVIKFLGKSCHIHFLTFSTKMSLLRSSVTLSINLIELLKFLTFLELSAALDIIHIIFLRIFLCVRILSSWFSFYLSGNIFLATHFFLSSNTGIPQAPL